MRYIEFGANHTKVSEVVLGMMRIWEMSREEWYEVYLSAGHQLP